MSVYLDVVIGCWLRPDTPDNIILEFKNVLGLLERDNLFTPMHQNIFDEYSHNKPRALQRSLESRGHGYYLTLRAKIKNLQNQINRFLDFLAEYAEDEGFIGYILNENHQYPTLVCIVDKRVVYKEAKEYVEVTHL